LLKEWVNSCDVTVKLYDRDDYKTPKAKPIGEPKPKPPAAPRPQPTPEQTAPPAPSRPSLPTVHPGSFCSDAGAKGVTVKGTPMTCKTTAADSRLRWRAC
jgi:hypothetical protein